MTPTLTHLSRVLLVLLLLLAAAGCSAETVPSTTRPAEPAALIVAGLEYRFVPATLAISATTPVVFRNDGALSHTWTVLATPIDDVRELDGATVLVEARVEVGQAATADMTAIPAGDYQIVCSIPGHFDAGMVGHITVLEN